jgi:L-asparagine transporter-like permease
MRRALVLIWTGTVLPFLLTILNGGPDGWLPHLLFHPAYIVFLALGLWGVLSLRRTTESRTVKGLATILVVAAAAATVGHLGEFIAVLLNGGFAADETVFKVDLHLWSANVTVPMVMLAMVLAVAITVAAGLSRSANPGPAINRWTRTAHRWASLVFVTVLPLAFTLQDETAVAIVVVVAFAVLLLTGLQMSVRHYATRWRRRRRRSAATRGPGPTADRQLTGSMT